MELLHFLSEHIAISLVALVVLIAITVFLAQKMSGSNASLSSPDQRTASAGPLNKTSPADAVELDQSPAAKAFREKLKDISLDLDKD